MEIPVHVGVELQYNIIKMYVMYCHHYSILFLSCKKEQKFIPGPIMAHLIAQKENHGQKKKEEEENHEFEEREP